MRAFASFILRGRPQAILVSTSAAALALLLPLLSHISGSTIALVTLYKGYVEGLLVLVVTSVVLTGLGLVSDLSPALVTAFAMSTILAAGVPVIIAAQVLRRSRDQGRALAVTAILAFLAMAGLQLAVEDPVAWWRRFLEAMLGSMLVQGPVPLTEADKAEIVESVALVMSGLMGAVLVYSTMINLFIGRWLQAIAFNPGGFRKEFHELRLGREAALAALGVMLLVTFSEGELANFARNLLILMVAVYSLHGLALVHGLVAAANAHIAWLVVLYLMLLFLLPQTMILLSAAGFADSWVDFRARFRRAS